jgi:hypothetical protein
VQHLTGGIYWRGRLLALLRSAGLRPVPSRQGVPLFVGGSLGKGVRGYCCIVCNSSESNGDSRGS